MTAAGKAETPRAATLFLDPTGATIGDSRQDEEGLAYAELDLNRCIEPKQFHDVVGYYNRFDVFDLTVTRDRPQPARWIDRQPAPAITGATSFQQRTLSGQPCTSTMVRAPCGFHSS